jgi:hypothetical protein
MPKEILDNGLTVAALVSGLIICYIVFWNSIKWIVFDLFHLLNGLFDTVIEETKKYLNKNHK